MTHATAPRTGTRITAADASDARRHGPPRAVSANGCASLRPWVIRATGPSTVTRRTTAAARCAVQPTLPTNVNATTAGSSAADAAQWSWARRPGTHHVGPHTSRVPGPLTYGACMAPLTRGCGRHPRSVQARDSTWADGVVSPYGIPYYRVKYPGRPVSPAMVDGAARLTGV